MNRAANYTPGSFGLREKSVDCAGKRLVWRDLSVLREKCTEEFKVLRRQGLYAGRVPSQKRARVRVFGHGGACLFDARIRYTTMRE